MARREGRVRRTGTTIGRGALACRETADGTVRRGEPGDARRTSTIGATYPGTVGVVRDTTTDGHRRCGSQARQRLEYRFAPCTPSKGPSVHLGGLLRVFLALDEASAAVSTPFEQPPRHVEVPDVREPFSQARAVNLSIDEDPGRRDPFTGQLPQEKLIKARQQQPFLDSPGEIPGMIAAKICQLWMERAARSAQPGQGDGGSVAPQFPYRGKKRDLELRAFSHSRIPSQSVRDVKKKKKMPLPSGPGRAETARQCPT